MGEEFRLNPRTTPLKMLTVAPIACLFVEHLPVCLSKLKSGALRLDPGCARSGPAPLLDLPRLRPVLVVLDLSSQGPSLLSAPHRTQTAALITREPRCEGWDGNVRGEHLLNQSHKLYMLYRVYP